MTSMDHAQIARELGIGTWRRLLIGGELRAPRGAASLESLDPTTGHVLAEIPAATVGPGSRTTGTSR